MNLKQKQYQILSFNLSQINADPYNQRDPREINRLINVFFGKIPLTTRYILALIHLL